jgi:hypothetical protein
MIVNLIFPICPYPLIDAALNNFKIGFRIFSESGGAEF